MAVNGSPSEQATTGNVTLPVDLRDVSDLHIHAAPDSRPRAINELDFAREAQQAGYRSILFKSHDFSCHDRTYLIRKAIPNFECFGSLCMNKVHGERVNPHAAKKAVETSDSLCKCIWMPTLDASYQYKVLNKSDKGIPVLDATGHVLPEVVQVMEICAEADIIFATGHSSPEESIILARKAHEVGVQKCVITHANSNQWKLSPPQINMVIELGAYVEFCYNTNLWGPGTGMPHFTRMSNEEFAALVSLAPERSFIATDLGQVGMPHPLEGMSHCITAMHEAGVSTNVLDQLVRINPARLMGLLPL